MKVIWTDGTLWGATFKGSNSQIVYKVSIRSFLRRLRPIIETIFLKIDEQTDSKPLKTNDE